MTVEGAESGFEAEAEEEVTARVIEEGISAEAFSQKLDENAASGGEFNYFSPHTVWK